MALRTADRHQSAVTKIHQSSLVLQGFQLFLGRCEVAGGRHTPIFAPGDRLSKMTP